MLTDSSEPLGLDAEHPSWGRSLAGPPLPARVCAALVKPRFKTRTGPSGHFSSKNQGQGVGWGQGRIRKLPERAAQRRWCSGSYSVIGPWGRQPFQDAGAASTQCGAGGSLDRGEGQGLTAECKSPRRDVWLSPGEGQLRPGAAGARSGLDRGPACGPWVRRFRPRAPWRCLPWGQRRQGERDCRGAAHPGAAWPTATPRSRSLGEDWILSPV